MVVLHPVDGYLQIVANSTIEFRLKCYVFIDYFLLIKLVVLILGLVFAKHTKTLILVGK